MGHRSRGVGQDGAAAEAPWVDSAPRSPSWWVHKQGHGRGPLGSAVMLPTKSPRASLQHLSTLVS